jgi:hypothetical protein
VTVAPDERRIRTIMAVGLVAALTGLGIASAYGRDLGGAICVLGWALLTYAVHRLGRLGST